MSDSQRGGSVGCTMLDALLIAVAVAVLLWQWWEAEKATRRRRF